MPSNVLVSGNWGCATIIDRDIPGVSLEYFKGSFDRCDLSKSNITKEQVLKLMDMDSSLGLYYSKLPTITFDGSEDFTGKRLIGVDMSSLVGISDITFATNSLSWSTSETIANALKAELSKMNAQELLDFKSKGRRTNGVLMARKLRPTSQQRKPRWIF